MLAAHIAIHQNGLMKEESKPKSKHGSTVVCMNGSLVITVMMLVGSFVVGVAEGTSVLKCGDVLGSSYTDIRLE